MMPMTRIVTLVMVSMALVWQAVSPPAYGASVSRTIHTGGLRRTFVLHVPPSVRSAPVPLVLALHGGGGTGAVMERSTGFSALADRDGGIVAYPDAFDHNWNDGRGDPRIRSQAEGIDDVGFILALITLLSKEYPIDPKRVFATGMSNGGFMSQLLAARLSERIAAIAAVSAGMAPAVAASLQPDVPVSILMMNGTDDPLVPYRGGPVARDRGETISTPAIIHKWVVTNQCKENPIVMQLPDTDPADGTRVQKTAYLECAGHAVIALYRIDGGGHAWPGGQQQLPQSIIGRVSRDIDATQVIWQFFANHPRL